LTNWFTIGTTGSTTFKDSNVSPGATWFYQVLAVNLGGISLASETAVATTAGTPADPDSDNAGV
jgi:chitodextrinase